MVTGWRSWRGRRASAEAAAAGLRWAAWPAGPAWPAGLARLAAAAPAVLLAAGVACGGGAGFEGSRTPAAGPPPEPGEVVARFLDAANRRDLDAMSRLFGTAAGPIGGRKGAFGCGLRRVGSWMGLGEPCVSAQEVELRMDVIARILAHESHSAGPAASVPGRKRPAASVEVEMVVASGEVVRVPFVLVRAGEHGWLVERVGLERLTG